MSLTKLSLAGARISRPSFRDTENERFWLVIAITGSINSGTGEFGKFILSRACLRKGDKRRKSTFKEAH